MSFSYSKTSPDKDAAVAHLGDDDSAKSVPEAIKAYVLAGINALPNAASVSVTVYGHVRGSFEGDSNPHSVTVEVKEVESIAEDAPAEEAQTEAVEQVADDQA